VHSCHLRILHSSDSPTSFSFLPLSIGTGIYLAHEFACLPSICYPHASSNHLGDDGVVALAPALERNKTLLELDLSHNGVATAGARALGESLVNNTTLRGLLLRGNQIDDSGEPLRQATCPTHIAVPTLLSGAPTHSLKSCCCRSWCLVVMAQSNRMKTEAAVIVGLQRQPSC
jgi:hypothetical protein